MLALIRVRVVYTACVGVRGRVCVCVYVCVCVCARVHAYMFNTTIQELHVHFNQLLHDFVCKVIRVQIQPHIYWSEPRSKVYYALRMHSPLNCLLRRKKAEDKRCVNKFGSALSCMYVRRDRW